MTMKFAREMDAELKEAEIDQEITDNANQEFIDIDYTVTDATTAPPEPAQEPADVGGLSHDFTVGEGAVVQLLHS